MDPSPNAPTYDLPDRMFALRVVQMGLLSHAQVDAARFERDRQKSTLNLAQWLEQAGLLSPAQGMLVAAALSQAAGGATLSPDAPAPAADRPTDTRAQSGMAGTIATDHATRPAFGIGRLGKYDLLEEIGRGGMGVVYRARDRELQRTVALKTLLLGEKVKQESAERLMREARTAGALDHPGIVPIHDFGVVDGVPYFAMSIIEGRSLDEIFSSGSGVETREKIRLIGQVAHAVAHAHSRGITHRDLKPSNVLVDAAGKPHVMDFGLAKRAEEVSKLTATGQMLGTPQYMPPEQIDGELEKIGPASDVYALGAVLYEAVTGRPPFEGNTVVEIVSRSLHRDPVPPRRLNPRVHADVETIILKSLEKEPVRRYPTAKEFADDLDRYLVGEPIAARRSGWSTLVLRRVRRNRTVTLLIGGVMLALGVAWFALRERSALQSRVREELRQKAANYLDTALSLRRAGMPVERSGAEYLPKLVTAVLESQRLDARYAEPSYHLGRMYRALLKFDEARQQQSEALSRDPAFKPARYERAILSARAYARRLKTLIVERERRALTRSELPRDPIARNAGVLEPTGATAAEVTPEELEQADVTAAELRRTLLADLAALAAAAPETSAAPDALALDEARLLCARGLALAYGSWRAEDRGPAIEMLSGAIERDPTLEEAYEGWAYLLERKSEWMRAVGVYERGLQVDQGYVPFWTGRASAYWRIALSRVERNDAGDEWFDKAAADLEKAVSLHPASRDAWCDLGNVRAVQALTHLRRGEDRPEQVARVLSLWQRGLERDPRAWELHALRAVFLREYGQVRQEILGADAREQYRAAIEACEQALAIAPEQTGMARCQVLARLNLAMADADRGLDPSAGITAVLDAASEGVRAHPDDIEFRLLRASVLTQVARRVPGRGAESEQRLQAATIEVEEAAGRAPDLAAVVAAQIEAWAALGDDRARRGESPIEAWEKVRACLDRLVSRRADDPGVWTDRARFLCKRALWEAGHNRPADDLFRQGMEDQDRAVGLNPTHYSLYGTRAMLRALWAENRAARGEDANDLFDRCRTDLERALALKPNDARLQSYASIFAVQMAIRPNRPTADVDVDFQRAFEHSDRAVAIAPQEVGWRVQRGCVLADWAGWRATQRMDPGDRFTRAMTDLDEAVRTSPGVPEVWSRRAGVLVSSAGWRAAHGESAKAILETGLEAVEKALALRPDDADSLLHGARACLLIWERSTSKVTDLPWLTRGEAYADRILATAPGHPAALALRVPLRAQNATMRMDSGQDPGERFELALQDANGLLELQPGNLALRYQRATLCNNYGYFKLTRGLDPTELYALGVRDTELLLAAVPQDVNTALVQGNLLGDWAIRMTLAGQDGSALFERSIRRFDELVAAYPKIAPCYSRRGNFRNWRAWSRPAGEREADLRAAEADLGTALALQPDLKEALIWRGWTRACLGREEQSAGRDPSVFWQGAEADLQAALALDPKSFEAHWRLGTLRAAQGRWTDAAVALEQAAQDNPMYAPLLRDELAEARKNKQ